MPRDQWLMLYFVIFQNHPPHISLNTVSSPEHTHPSSDSRFCSSAEELSNHPTAISPSLFS
jgi:hypothetical protein